MEQFFKIRAEKQNHIVDAAFSVFGRQGYKKASLTDIAQSAGITKGMITYYFGSKKTLYLYLVDVSQAQLIHAIKDNLSPTVTDFFEKMRIMTEIQVAALRKHPALISFVNSLFNETDPEVADEIHFNDEFSQLKNLLLSGADLTKFKPDFAPKLLCKFIFWAERGFMEELYDTAHTETPIDELTTSFYGCLAFFEKAFYKD
jgi:AcrR family transcriptional regulator